MHLRIELYPPDLLNPGSPLPVYERFDCQFQVLYCVNSLQIIIVIPCLVLKIGPGHNLLYFDLKKSFTLSTEPPCFIILHGVLFRLWALRGLQYNLSHHAPLHPKRAHQPIPAFLGETGAGEQTKDASLHPRKEIVLVIDLD